MFSVWKMIKKGLIAVAAFGGPVLIGIIFKVIPGLNSLTIGEVIISVIDKIVPGLPALTVGAGLIMLINFLKNRK